MLEDLIARERINQRLELARQHRLARRFQRFTKPRFGDIVDN